MDNFDREFNRQFKRTGRIVWVMFTVNVLITIAVLGAIGWAGYALLKHFGIVG